MKPLILNFFLLLFEIQTKCIFM